MQVLGQNTNQIKTQPQQFSANSCTNPNISNAAPQTQPAQYPLYPTGQPQQTSNVCPQPVAQQQYPACYNPVQNTVYPPVPQQTQNMPLSASGVTIQIFNPSVQTPGAQAPTYNVNAPCYPSGYYTGQMGADGKIHTSGGDINNSGGTINGPVNTGTNTGTMGDNNNNNNTTITTNNNNTSTQTDEKKKTEKRKIVQLTDDYIRNLESYLNSQEKAVRLSAAKEVYARLEEDESRHDDKALTALINKMLQDPSEEIRIIALTALDSRICKGDDYTVGVLQNIQKTTGGYGQDAIDASNVLLKMSGKQVEKEFEVKDKPKKETSTKETKKA